MREILGWVPGAKPWGGQHHVGVTNGTAQVKLAIEIGSDPIAGSVTVGTGAPQRFSGWIELVAAIESARHAGATNGAEGLRSVTGASGGQV
jgi:hypothetical protein